MDTSGNRTANVGKTIEGSRFRPLSTREARSLFLPSSYQVINCDRDRGHSLRLLGGKNRNVAAGERRWITTIERGGALWRCTVTRKKYYYFYYTTVVMVVAGGGESWRRIHYDRLESPSTVDAHCTAYATQLLRPMHYAKPAFPWHIKMLQSTNRQSSCPETDACPQQRSSLT